MTGVNDQAELIASLSKRIAALERVVSRRPSIRCTYPFGARFECATNDHYGTGVGSWRSSANPTVPQPYTVAAETAGNIALANPVYEWENYGWPVRPGWSANRYTGTTRANATEVDDFEIVLAALEWTAGATTDGYLNSDADNTYTELWRYVSSTDRPAGSSATTRNAFDATLDYTWERNGEIVMFVRSRSTSPLTALRYITVAGSLDVTTTPN